MTSEMDRPNRDRNGPSGGEIRQPAQLDGEMLQAIVENLPIGLTVQAEDGRFIVANATAAANLSMRAEDLIGASPADFLTGEDAASRRQWEQDVVRQNEVVTVEAIVPDEKREQTWLVSHKPIEVRGQTLLVASSVDVTHYKELERRLAERAHIDELTALPNRALMEQHVEALIQHDEGNTRFALAFIDLDNFKHINDYYSHYVGDALLVKISQRIASCLRPRDKLARISGDEFLLLLDPVDNKEEIKSIIDNIQRDIKKPFYIDMFEVFSSCSLGVSFYPEHGRDYEVLRRSSDSAMYRAKQVAKGDAVYFDLAMARSMTARMEVEQRLRLALRDQEFCCAFQPKVDIHSHEVVGFEALMRWRDANGEINPPGEFIALAIELGLMNPITELVLREAIDSMDLLDATFGPGMSVSINIAAKQANDPIFMGHVVQTLKESKRADRIMIELTEEAFVAKGTFQNQVLPLLRENGVRVSIDDFGTGYSSLSALADITADELKIDRSFVTAIHERPRSQSVLRAIESLGRALGMTIIAEGVETFEELAYLQAATGIRQVQGFYFAKPFYLQDLRDTGLVGRVREAPRARGDLSSVVPPRLAVAARSNR
jgi:diguanylate cyclase (GGDEF)-like protein/PAS domain S-box-containing protein